MNWMDHWRFRLPLIDRLPVGGWGRHRYGIHLGDSNVALLEARGTGSRVQFTRAGIESVARPENEEYGRALQTLTKRLEIPGATPVSMAIPTSDVILRSVSFPDLSEHRLREAVQYEAEADLPFGTDELVYDYLRVPGESEAGGTRVLMVLARDGTIQDRVNVLRDSGLAPERIDVSALCLFRFWRRQRGREPRSPDYGDCPELLVHVQERSLGLVFYEGDRLLYARSLNRSEEKPTEFQVGPVPREDPGKQAGVSRVEFSRTIEHFRQELREDPVDRVWVLGDLESDGSVHDSLSRYFEVPVEVVDRLESRLPLEVPDRQAFMVPGGLIGQPASGEPPCDVDLIPSGLRCRREETRRRRQRVWMGVLSGLALLQLLVGFGWTHHSRGQQLDVLKRQHKKIRPLAERVRSLRERTRSLEETLNRLQVRTRRGLTLLPVLARIGEPPASLVETTRLSSLELRSGEDGPELEMSGYTRDFRSASRLYDWVTSRSPVQAQTSRKQSSVRRDDHRRVRFRARFSLHLNSHRAEKSAAAGVEPPRE